MVIRDFALSKSFTATRNFIRRDLCSRSQTFVNRVDDLNTDCVLSNHNSI